jgi:hypothetical protein
MRDGDGRGGYDGFNWTGWGKESTTDGRSDDAQEEAGVEGDERSQRATGEGRWVSAGGVMRWESNSGAEESASEAASRWAADDLDLPPGAPDPIRVRATRAWLLRQRAAESEAMGYLLLERRRLQVASDSRESAQSGAASGEAEGPLDVALAEHQAAIQEYERLVEALDEIGAHTGPAHLLVEFYLRINERLAELAADPAAPAGFAAALLLAPVEDEEAAGPGAAPPTPGAQAEWQGRAEAVLYTRKRVERLTAPEPED